MSTPQRPSPYNAATPTPQSTSVTQAARRARAKVASTVAHDTTALRDRIEQSPLAASTPQPRPSVESDLRPKGASAPQTRKGLADTVVAAPRAVKLQHDLVVRMRDEGTRRKHAFLEQRGLNVRGEVRTHSPPPALQKLTSLPDMADARPEVPSGASGHTLQQCLAVIQATSPKKRRQAAASSGPIDATSADAPPVDLQDVDLDTSDFMVLAYALAGATHVTSVDLGNAALTPATFKVLLDALHTSKGPITHVAFGDLVRATYPTWVRKCTAACNDNKKRRAAQQRAKDAGAARGEASAPAAESAGAGTAGGAAPAAGSAAKAKYRGGDDSDTFEKKRALFGDEKKARAKLQGEERYETRLIRQASRNILSALVALERQRKQHAALLAVMSTVEEHEDTARRALYRGEYKHSYDVFNTLQTNCRGAVANAERSERKRLWTEYCLDYDAGQRSRAQRLNRDRAKRLQLTAQWVDGRAGIADAMWAERGELHQDYVQRSEALRRVQQSAWLSGMDHGAEEKPDKPKRAAGTAAHGGQGMREKMEELLKNKLTLVAQQETAARAAIAHHVDGEEPRVRAATASTDAAIRTVLHCCASLRAVKQAFLRLYALSPTVHVYVPQGPVPAAFASLVKGQSVTLRCCAAVNVEVAMPEQWAAAVYGAYTHWERLVASVNAAAEALKALHAANSAPPVAASDDAPAKPALVLPDALDAAVAATLQSVADVLAADAPPTLIAPGCDLADGSEAGGEKPTPASRSSSGATFSLNSSDDDADGRRDAAQIVAALHEVRNAKERVVSATVTAAIDDDDDATADAAGATKDELLVQFGLSMIEQRDAPQWLKDAVQKDAATTTFVQVRPDSSTSSTVDPADVQRAARQLEVRQTGSGRHEPRTIKLTVQTTVPRLEFMPDAQSVEALDTGKRDTVQGVVGVSYCVVPPTLMPRGRLEAPEDSQHTYRAGGEALRLMPNASLVPHPLLEAVAVEAHDAERSKALHDEALILTAATGSHGSAPSPLKARRRSRSNSLAIVRGAPRRLSLPPAAHAALTPLSTSPSSYKVRDRTHHSVNGAAAPSYVMLHNVAVTVACVPCDVHDEVFVAPGKHGDIAVEAHVIKRKGRRIATINMKRAAYAIGLEPVHGLCLAILFEQPCTVTTIEQVVRLVGYRNMAANARVGDRRFNVGLCFKGSSEGEIVTAEAAAAAQPFSRRRNTVNLQLPELARIAADTTEAAVAEPLSPALQGHAALLETMIKETTEPLYGIPTAPDAPVTGDACEITVRAGDHPDVRPSIGAYSCAVPVAVDADDQPCTWSFSSSEALQYHGRFAQVDRVPAAIVTATEPARLFFAEGCHIEDPDTEFFCGGRLRVGLTAGASDAFDHVDIALPVVPPLGSDGASGGASDSSQQRITCPLTEVSSNRRYLHVQADDTSALSARQVAERPVDKIFFADRHVGTIHRTLESVAVSAPGEADAVRRNVTGWRAAVDADVKRCTQVEVVFEDDAEWTLGTLNLLVRALVYSNLSSCAAAGATSIEMGLMVGATVGKLDVGGTDVDMAEKLRNEELTHTARIDRVAPLLSISHVDITYKENSGDAAIFGPASNIAVAPDADLTGARIRVEVAPAECERLDALKLDLPDAAYAFKRVGALDMESVLPTAATTFAQLRSKLVSEQAAVERAHASGVAGRVHSTAAMVADDVDRGSQWHVVASSHRRQLDVHGADSTFVECAAAAKRATDGAVATSAAQAFEVLALDEETPSTVAHVLLRRGGAMVTAFAPGVDVGTERCAVFLQSLRYANTDRNPHILNKTLIVTMTQRDGSQTTATVGVRIIPFDDPTEITLQYPAAQHFRLRTTETEPWTKGAMKHVGRFRERFKELQGIAKHFPESSLPPADGTEAVEGRSAPRLGALLLFNPQYTEIDDPDTDFWDGGSVTITCTAGWMPACRVCLIDSAAQSQLKKQHPKLAGYTASVEGTTLTVEHDGESFAVGAVAAAARAATGGPGGASSHDAENPLNDGDARPNPDDEDAADVVGTTVADGPVDAFSITFAPQPAAGEPRVSLAMLRYIVSCIGFSTTVAPPQPVKQAYTITIRDAANPKPGKATFKLDVLPQLLTFHTPESTNMVSILEWRKQLEANNAPPPPRNLVLAYSTRSTTAPTGGEPLFPSLNLNVNEREKLLPGAFFEAYIASGFNPKDCINLKFAGTQFVMTSDGWVMAGREGALGRFYYTPQYIRLDVPVQSKATTYRRLAQLIRSLHFKIDAESRDGGIVPGDRVITIVVGEGKRDVFERLECTVMQVVVTVQDLPIRRE